MEGEGVIDGGTKGTAVGVQSGASSIEGAFIKVAKAEGEHSARRGVVLGEGGCEASAKGVERHSGCKDGDIFNELAQMGAARVGEVVLPGVNVGSIDKSREYVFGCGEGSLIP